MNYDEVLTLVNAGYSKEEIENMRVSDAEPSHEASLQNEVETDPASTGSAEASPQNEAEVLPQSVADQIAGFIKDTSAAINKEIEKLEKAYQEYNINQANNQLETSKGVDDVIATIINPPYMVDKKGEK